jgi:hypothetical protein
MSIGDWAAAGLIARVRSCWRGLRRRDAIEAEMTEEFRHHLELRTADLVQGGLSRGDTARQARVEFGHDFQRAAYAGAGGWLPQLPDGLAQFGGYINNAAADVERLLDVSAPAAFYVPPAEALEYEVARVEGGHFNLIHRDTALRADVYLRGNDPLHAWALQRRVRVQLEPTSSWVAPIEYVIVRKLQYFQISGSDRHVRDVAMILQISGDAVDPDALDEWVRRMRLEEPLGVARANRTG